MKNREIKFRAWDKIMKTMKYPEPYENGEGHCPDSLKGKVNPAVLIDEDGGGKSRISDVLMADIYIPMQYTGLKDKNGKEIYEGDILGAKFHPQWVERIPWKGDPDAICEVFWDLCGLRLKAFGKKDSRYPDMHDINYKETEVIGNIYENPELIKQTK